MKKTSQEQVKLMQQTRKLIVQHTKSGLVHSVDVIKSLSDLGTHNMNFYYFVYGGVLTKVRHGIYKMESTFKASSNESILTKAYAYLAESKTKSKAKLKEAVSPEKIPALSERDAIDYLKNLGYKVMKPVAQFEEV